MTTTAPSVAPDETPSVSGDASGFRRNAWNTTPAIAKALPTSADARTRGSRATKNTWASTLSANGIVRSNTRDKMDRRAADERRRSGRRRRSARRSPQRRGQQTPPEITGVAAKRHHGQVSGAGMRRHVGDRPRTASRTWAGVSTLSVGPWAMTRPSFSSTSSVAQRRRQVQVVRRHDHRRPAVAVQAREQRRDLELKAEVQRGGRLVEQQHVRRLSQRAGDHDALFLAAAERRRTGDPRSSRCRCRPSRAAAIARSLAPSSSNAPR